MLWQTALPTALYGGDTLHLYFRSMASAPQSTPKLLWIAKNRAMQEIATQLQNLPEQMLPRLVGAQQIAALELVKDSQA